jgi:hypothetical protein
LRMAEDDTLSLLVRRHTEIRAKHDMRQP